MVRKRAHAQKGLSPKKAASNNKKEPEQQLSNELQLNDSLNGSEIDIPLPSDAQSPHSPTPSFEFSFSDDLPDLDSFPKEISEKAKGYWNCLQQDYYDFTSWTCLLQNSLENDDNLPALDAVFQCFLRYYPYCYGYWKKFADIGKKHEHFEQCEQVFANGVKSISVSIDLWVHYLNFVIQQNRDDPKGAGKVRELFKQAINAAGMDFKSNKLWDLYIQWERSLGNHKKVTEIYDSLIRTPNQQYIKNWTKFKEHLEAHSPSVVLSTEEYMKVMQELDIIPPGMTNEDDLTVITAIPALEEDDMYKLDNDLSELEKSVQKNADLIRKKVIGSRESVFLQTASEIKKRWRFEEAIKRPYFHVKPLEKSQIKNWKEYLDYEMSQGNHARICFLFERCMVVCALYEEFWQRYIDYVEERDVEATRSAYSRACNIHLQKKYNMHIKWAVFEEKQKQYENAANILTKVDENFPGMILITQHRIGLARRMKRFDEIESIYENSIKTADRIEDKIFYSIKFSHVLAKFCGDKSKARLVLLDALKLGKKQKRLYLQLLDVEMHYGVVEDEHVLSLFTSVENDMSLTDDVRYLFAHRKVEFCEEYGNDIQSVIKARNNFETQRKKYPPRKRKISEIPLPDNPPLVKKGETAGPTSTNIPETFGYNPENPSLFPNDGQQQPYYNWDAYQQLPNYTPQQ